jgi:coproporphyrinogen III oxidase-like Fe-S oxidoreductase
MAPIDRNSAVEEMLMMGLRLIEGVARVPLERVAGQSVEGCFGGNLAPLVEGGFLALDGDRLAATAAGRQRLNAVLAALLC